MMTGNPPFITANTSDLANYILTAIETLPNNYAFNSEDFITILNDFAQANRQIFLELSTVHPDYEAIKQQLNANLASRTGWRDIIQASGGSDVVDFIASIGAYCQSAVATGLQETNLDTAGLTSSIYVIMRMLGVHILRKRPAEIAITWTSTLAYTAVIPSLTQFNIDGVNYFNRLPIVFKANGTQTGTLYQGTLSTIGIQSTGYPFQRFEVGNSDYLISDSDIYCFQADGTTYTAVQDGLWKYSAKDQIFAENTTPEGNVEILFGNDLYGKIPSANTLMAFVYASTNGATANGTGLDTTALVKITSFNQFSPDRISFATDAQTQAYQTALTAGITGLPTASAFNGSDQYPAEYYRAVGPYLGSGKKGMIRKQEHYAIGLQYPGVVDILFRNQKDISPYNRNLINCVYVTPLMTGGVLMTDAQWLDFVDFLNTRQIWRVDWVLYQPVAIPIDIVANLYVKTGSDITNVVNYATYNINRNIGVRRGALGASAYLDQIRKFLNVDYQNIKVEIVDLRSPKINTIINPWEYITINSLSLTPSFDKSNYLTYSENADLVYTPLT